MNGRTTIKWMWYAGTALCLLQVLLPAYFLTGDGPCHVYNARILQDLHNGHDGDFYGHYYYQLKAPNPNWLAHIALALLMYVANGAWAEKILISAYVLLSATGYYKLLSRIDGQRSLWPLVGLAFIFQHFLMKGFYNFSLSLGLFAWLLISWLSYLEKGHWRRLLLFVSFVFLVFFTHPIAYVSGVAGCFFLLLSHHYAVANKKEKGSFVKRIVAFSVIQLPFLAMLLKFSGPAATRIVISIAAGRIKELLQFTALPSVTQGEVPFALLIAGVIVALSIIALLHGVRTKGLKNKYSGLYALIVVLLFFYFYFPDTLLGGGMFIPRLQLLLFFTGACAIASLPVPRKLLNAGAITIYCCFVCMSMLRLPVLMAAGKGTADYCSVSRYIKPRSVVLPLSFSHNGKDEQGRVISNYNWLFTHAADYIGSEKPLIMLDNYEAHTGYFPLVWQRGTNPYQYLMRGNGFEDQLPDADLKKYTDSSQGPIDYIITWCRDEHADTNTATRAFMQEVNARYDAIYTSPSQRTTLYERRKMTAH